MRVLDLLQLLQDYPPNTLVRIQAAAEENIDHFQETVVSDQQQLIIVPKVDGKPLKRWELTLLLNRADWRQRFLYVQAGTDIRPLFGLQEQTGGLVLN